MSSRVTESLLNNPPCITYKTKCISSDALCTCIIIVVIQGILRNDATSLYVDVCNGCAAQAYNYNIYTVPDFIKFTYYDGIYILIR